MKKNKTYFGDGIVKSFKLTEINQYRNKKVNELLDKFIQKKHLKVGLKRKRTKLSTTKVRLKSR